MEFRLYVMFECGVCGGVVVCVVLLLFGGVFGFIIFVFVVYVVSEMCVM